MHVYIGTSPSRLSPTLPPFSLESDLAQAARQALPRHGEAVGHSAVAHDRDNREANESERPPLADLSNLLQIVTTRVGIPSGRSRGSQNGKNGEDTKSRERKRGTTVGISVDWVDEASLNCERDHRT